ncbi:MAG: G5 domain-containing protein [Clostridia bacterium]|nr:G5 domain-containing protein [Clostridia bacterium]
MKARVITADEGIKHFRLKVIIAVIVLILLSCGTVAATETVVKTTVMCEGEAKTVITLSGEPETIIAHTPYKIEEGDRLITDYFSAENGGFLIIAKPHQVLLYDEDELIKILTVTGTAGDAVAQAGVELKDGDELSIGEHIVLSSDMKLKIERAFTVKVTVDGETKKINTVGGTTEKVLKKAGIILGEDDIVSPAKDEEITKSRKIKVQRVTYKTYKKTEVIPFETKIEYDEDKYYEEVSVKQKGKDGKAVNYYKETYIDGKKTKTEITETKIKKEARDKIILRGSKGSLYGGKVYDKVISEVVPPYRIDLDENNRPINYKKKITGKATAYCTGTITSTGRRAQPGVVAVDPREIPYGTKLYIVSSDNRYVYGYAIAGDTGGFIHNSSTVVDLYIRGYDACKQFGRRNVDIYVLE